MKSNLQAFLNFTKTRINDILSLVNNRQYRPLVLKFGDIIRVNPIIIFIVFIIVSFFIRNLPGFNLTNSVGISFVIPYLIFFQRYPKIYLERLRPTLKISEEEFEALMKQGGHYHFGKFLFVTLLAPVLWFVVNYHTFANPSEALSRGLMASNIYALFTGALLLQMNYITITEVYRFNKIAKQYAEVDLLDIHKLDSFSHVGIMAGMSIIGIYIVIPISLLNEPELLYSLISSVVISVPILLINLFIPLYRVYMEIKVILTKEKRLIRAAIEGDQSSLQELAIYPMQPNLNMLELIEYRRYVNDLSPIPIAQHHIVRFLGSIGFLIISWVVPILL